MPNGTILELNKSRNLTSRSPRSGLDAAGQCRSSCCRCCLLDLRTLLLGLAATCSLLVVLEFSPRELSPPDSRNKKNVKTHTIKRSMPRIWRAGIHSFALCFIQGNRIKKNKEKWKTNMLWASKN